MWKWDRIEKGRPQADGEVGFEVELVIGVDCEQDRVPYPNSCV
jgi:hypothetical protein